MVSSAAAALEVSGLPIIRAVVNNIVSNVFVIFWDVFWFHLQI